VSRQIVGFFLFCLVGGLLVVGSILFLELLILFLLAFTVLFAIGGTGGLLLLLWWCYST
jgi:hypothetical protein